MSNIKQSPFTINKVLDHPSFKHFLAYSMSYILLGSVITCLGPMFPYLADHEGRLQTEYSFLFVCRASGFICGSILMRLIGSGKFTLHQLISSGILTMGVCYFCFGISENMYIRGFFVFGASIGCSFQDVVINLAALDCFKGQNMAVWLQTIHGAFGIGGLLGPFLVYLFQLNTLTFLGVIAILSVPLYFVLQTPQKMVDIKKLQQEDNKKLQLPMLSVYLIASGFLFAVGQQVSYGGWISSYAVLWNFSTKQHATFYGSLYWISITFFRFTMAALPGSPEFKIKGLALVGIFSSFIGYFLIFNVNSEFGLIVTSILYGLCNSVLFPLLLTIPQQFGFELTLKQSSIFIIWASIGEGCLSVGVGKMMEIFSYNWLLYSVCVFNILMYAVIHFNKLVLQQQIQNAKPENMQKLMQNYSKKQTINSNIQLNYELQQIKR